MKSQMTDVDVALSRAAAQLDISCSWGSNDDDPFLRFLFDALS
jgi:hypothetical protein